MTDKSLEILEQYELEDVQVRKGRGNFIVHSKSGDFVLKEYNGKTLLDELLDLDSVLALNSVITMYRTITTIKIRTTIFFYIQKFFKILFLNFYQIFKF